MDRLVRGTALCRAFAAIACLFVPFHSAAAAPETISLKANWNLGSASWVGDAGERISQSGTAMEGWYPVRQVPATVLEILQEDGVYPNLYYGENLLSEVPQDLYQQDWWYRTSFTAPSQGNTYWLDFPGINYRAEIWLNGKRIADNRQIVGMYVAHDVECHGCDHAGANGIFWRSRSPPNAPSRTSMAWSWRIAGSTGSTGNTSDTRRLSARMAFRHPLSPTAMLESSNPSRLRVTGPVRVSHPSVNTTLPLPNTAPASLTVFGVLENGSPRPVTGRVLGQITAAGQTGDPVSGGGHAQSGRKPRSRLHAGAVSPARDRQSGPLVALHDGPAQPL